MHPLVATLACLVFCGCGGGGSKGPVSTFRNEALRIAGPRTAGGEGDALATALLLVTSSTGTRRGRPVVGSLDQELRERLRRRAMTHLETAALRAGAGGGMAGSAYIRRLAATADAPADRDLDGTNLDETLADHVADLAMRAGTAVDPGLSPILFPWSEGSADFATAVDPLRPRGPTSAVRPGRITIAQVGQGMLARSLLGGALLQEKGAPFAVGLLLLQQAIAAEETLFASAFMAGAVLDGLPFPADYAPAQGSPVRWLPAVFEARDDPLHPGVIGAYGIVDRASTVASIAAVLGAAGELSLVADPTHPDPDIRHLFQGDPFGQFPSSGGGTPSALVTWEGGVSALLRLHCGACHTGPFPMAGFSLDSYDLIHRGGINSAPESKTPIIVRGQPEASLLYRILREPPPPPFFRMPLGGPYLSASEIDLVGRWIEDGARSAPPGPPRIGLDLARVNYRSLIALHLAPSGALYERHEGDAPVAHADALGTGQALQALAAIAHLESELPEYRGHLRSIAEFAAAELVSPDGDVFRSYDLERGVAAPLADGPSHAALIAGLFAAAEVLGDAPLLARAIEVAGRWVARFHRPADGLFATAAIDATGAGAPPTALRYRPAELAACLDALRHMVATDQPDARSILDRFLARLEPVLVFAEIEGETLGDGIADTDGNGIAEPVLAGGGFGRAPLLAGDIRDGADGEGEPVAAITWSAHVQPLFRSVCARCHMDGAAEGGYRLDTPALLRMAGDSKTTLPFIVPGDPEASYLYRKLVDRDPVIGEQMPLQTPPLDASGKALVRDWIRQGASSR